VRILYAVLCEDARERHDGRLDVHGVFHQLYAPGFPARQDRMMLATAVEWEPHERGRIDFTINLVDPDDSPAITISGNTDVSDQGPLMAPPQTRIVIPLEDVVFRSAGAYEFELEVGGETHKLAPFYLFENPEE
jgi:hypothetical protein